MNKLIPCVGFELQYSPLDRDSLDNFAITLHGKINELVFEVFRAVEPGTDIIIMFSNKSGPSQQIPAEVISCTQLDNEHYRLGLRTKDGCAVRDDAANLICLPVNRGPATAHEMVLPCPSCDTRGPFKFIANQNGDWEQGILPIYNCDACGTSRAMVGLVS